MRPSRLRGRPCRLLAMKPGERIEALSTGGGRSPGAGPAGGGRRLIRGERQPEAPSPARPLSRLAQPRVPHAAERRARHGRLLDRHRLDRRAARLCGGADARAASTCWAWSTTCSTTPGWAPARSSCTRPPVEPEDLLRSVCELLSPRAHDKGARDRLGGATAGLPPVLADEGRLRQILLNLAGNAVKFTEAGGVLLLAEARGRAGARCASRVSDTGPGVPEAERERIFEAFAQAARPRRARRRRRPRPGHRPPPGRRPWAARWASDGAPGGGARLLVRGAFAAGRPGRRAAPPLAGRKVAVVSPSADRPRGRGAADRGQRRPRRCARRACRGGRWRDRRAATSSWSTTRWPDGAPLQPPAGPRRR